MSNDQYTRMSFYELINISNSVGLCQRWILLIKEGCIYDQMKGIVMFKCLFFQRNNNNVFSRK